MMISALKILFEQDSKTSALMELAVPTISTNLLCTGTNPQILCEPTAGREANKHEHWARLDRVSGPALDGRTRVGPGWTNHDAGKEKSRVREFKPNDKACSTVHITRLLD
jgi:hypothetical protein